MSDNGNYVNQWGKMIFLNKENLLFWVSCQDAREFLKFSRYCRNKQMSLLCAFKLLRKLKRREWAYVLMRRLLHDWIVGEQYPEHAIDGAIDLPYEFFDCKSRHSSYMSIHCSGNICMCEKELDWVIEELEVIKKYKEIK